MLPRVRLIQIGDIHLPTAAKAGRSVDQKDKAFSVELRNLISDVPIKVVFRQIFKLISDGNINAVLAMGDFTDRGNIDNYERCAAFLANSLQLGEGRLNANCPLGIVPGNHDINRELAKKPGLATKFTPLNSALHKHQLSKLPVEQSTAMDVVAGAAKMQVMLMNSCWGCGAVEFIPAGFRDSIGKAIEDTLASGDESLLQTYYDRQFDTPAFSNDSISALVTQAADLEQNTLLVLAAHHNLLPQRLTRLAPYTELVNSGSLRSSLLEAGRPVLYLHGHIHEDPVEVISAPGGDNLVCISAPAAEDGFNVVEVVYTRLGAPLVCQVYPWRFDNSRVLRQQERKVVPLIGRRRRSHNRGLSKVFGHLLVEGECYWSDLIAQPAFFPSDNDAQLQESIELLAADESVLVENYTGTPEHWIVRANI